MALAADAIKLTDLEKHLGRCGYEHDKLVRDYRFDGGTVPLVGFASTPHDARSACVAVIESTAQTPTEVQNLRETGAPVVLAYKATQLEWWKQTTGKPERIEAVPKTRLAAFFDAHKSDFSPLMIYEGKTRRRLPGQTQLHFVDAGLMPLVERDAGEALSQLMGRVIRGMEDSLGRRIRSLHDVESVFKSAFWLLAAKMLRDKQVPDFKTINLLEIDEVFRRVGRHYGDTNGLPPGGPAWRDAIEESARKIERFAHLGNVSTEALAYLYENALIPDEVRAALGTHSTPSALVDYMVWQLWPWIDSIPEENRFVFEPACGHGAFLVGMLRELRQWSSIADGKKRHDYLKKHLCGVEVDSFALEIAKLSLTLADIPYGNMWDLKQSDMYLDGTLESGSRRTTILLANPPFEKFTPNERADYLKRGVPLRATTKASELLHRTIPHLVQGACFGVVVPLGFLHSGEATELRRHLLKDFELAEIDVFEDRLFNKGQPETAVLLGRRKVEKIKSREIAFRRVLNSGMDAFRGRFAFSNEEKVPVSRFTDSPIADLRVPMLRSVWEHLCNYPPLDEVAILGQGLTYKGKDLPKDTWTIRLVPRSGDARGFGRVTPELKIYGLPPIVGMNLDPSVLLHVRAGLPTGAPQVLLNYIRVSRGPWRLKAVIDTEGLALGSAFTAVRPKDKTISVLALWALLNSPLANAYAHCHSMKRQVLVGIMRRMPIPQLLPHHVSRIEEAASRYRQLATSAGPLFGGVESPRRLRDALLAMDAAVLQSYDLPPRFERQLLDWFVGAKRKGVGCDFNGYYPEGMDAYVPLRELISDAYTQSTLGKFREHLKPISDPAILAALKTAADSFGKE